MEFKNTLLVLHAHTDEIKRILDRLEKSDEIRAIDLDLLLEKLRTVYDVVTDLRSEVQSGPVSVENDAPPDVLLGDKKRVVDLTAKPEQEESEYNTKQEKAIKSVSSKQEETPAEPDLMDQEEDEVGSVLSDRFKPENPTLNDEIGSHTKQEDISSQLNTNPITSLTGAIGLNEKFELINELFDGDKSKFDQTMQVMNSSNSFVEAYSYLEGKFDWDMENPFVQRILELIRRKLIVRRNEQ